MTFALSPDLSIVSDHGFEVVVNGSSVDYSDATCTATVAADAEDLPLLLDVGSIALSRTVGDPEGTNKERILSRTIAGLCAVGIPVCLHSAVAGDTTSDGGVLPEVLDLPELLTHAAGLSGVSLVEFLRLLDALAEGRAVDLRAEHFRISGGNDGTLAVEFPFVSSRSGDAVTMSLDVDASLAAMHRSLLDNSGPESRSALRWVLAEITPPEPAFTPVEAREAVGPLAAVVEVEVLEGATEVDLAMGSEASCVTARSASAVCEEIVTTEASLGALARSVWGDGARSVGPCRIRITTAAGTFARSEATDDAEDALNWILAHLESAATPAAVDR